MKHLFLSFGLLFTLHLTAQAPTFIWNNPLSKTFGNITLNDQGRYMIPIANGDYLFVGLSGSNVWAVKLDKDGQKKMDKVYSPTVASVFTSVAAVEVAGGYVIAANQTSNATNKNWRFMVQKSDLTMIPDKSQTSEGGGSACLALRASDGLLLLGSPASAGVDRAAQVEVLDSSSLLSVDLLNGQSFGTPSIWGENLQLILPANDGGFYLFGECKDFSEAACTVDGLSRQSDVWVCKLDAQLKPVWSRNYGGVTPDIFTDAALRENGNLLLLGRTACSGLGPNGVATGSWLLELTPEGEIGFVKSVKKLEPDAIASQVTGLSLLKNCPDGVLLSGFKGGTAPLGGRQGYLAKVRIGSATDVINSNIVGSGTWSRNFLPSLGSLIYFLPEDVQPLADGKILAWGTASTTNGNSGDFWTVLLDADGTVCGGDPRVGAIPVNCGDNRVGDIADAANNKGQYGSYVSGGALPATATYVGPDKAYKITVPAALGRVNLRVVLDILDASRNLDLFLFGNTSTAGCIGACTEDGTGSPTKRKILEKILEPGTYFVVVDGRLNTDISGFNLRFECGCNCTCVESPADSLGKSANKLLSEDFQAYNTGNLDPQSSRWRESLSQPPVQTEPSNPSNKVLGMKGTANVMPSLAYELAPLPNNRYRLSWRMFVSKGSSAYYNLLRQTPGSFTNQQEHWIYEIAINNGASQIKKKDGSNNVENSKNFTAPENRWFQVTHIFDMGQDSMELWVDNKFVGKWYYNTDQNDSDDPTDDDSRDFILPKLRFFTDATSDYRVDDLCLWEKKSCFPIPPATPNLCLSTPGDRIYTSLGAARCDLYTSKELQPCQTVCETNGTVFHRDPDFSGIVGPMAPPSLSLISDCVQGLYDNRNQSPVFADLVVFYNETAKRIGVTLNDTRNGNTAAFVFQCLCEPSLENIFAIDGNIVTANGCEQLCLGRVGDNNGYDNNTPRPKGYYYILILSPIADTYSLDIIPEGDCGGNITPLSCGVPTGGGLTNEDNRFDKVSNKLKAYINYNGPRKYTGRDKVYSFTLQHPQYIDLSLTSNRGMGLFLYTDQCGQNPILYRETPDAGGTALLDSFFLPAAIYFLTVDEAVDKTVTSFTLKLDQCMDAGAGKFLQQFSAQLNGPVCAVDANMNHTVSLASTAFNAPEDGKPAIALNDLIHFKFKDPNNGNREGVSSFLFWNGTGLNFALPADASGGPICGYRTGDSLRLAIQHYNEGASTYMDYAISFQPNDPAIFSPNKTSSVAALTPQKVPAFFKVNPLFLNPSDLGGEYLIRGLSSDFDWEIVEYPSDFSWIVVPSPKETAYSMVDKSVKIEPYTGTAPREAMLVFRSASTAPEYRNYSDTVRILQRGVCTTPQSASVSVNPSPVCPGQAFTLKVTNPKPYFDYLWSNGKVGKTIVGIAPDLSNSTAQVTFNYSVTVYDRACGIALPGKNVPVTVKQGDWKSQLAPTQNNLITGEKSGTSIVGFGDWVAVGSPEWNPSTGVTKAGRVLLYKRTVVNGQETWAFQKALTAPTPTTNDFFGYRVSMNGDFLIVGAPAFANAITGGTGTKGGAAYIYMKDKDGKDNWGQVGAKLSQGTAFNNFGCAVSLSGDYAFVGADANASNAGAVYMYHRNEGGINNWGNLITQTMSGVAGSKFGCSLMTEGDFLVVGAKNDQSFGSAQVFTRQPFAFNSFNPHNWASTALLQPNVADDKAEAGDQFGYAVAIRGDQILVGAPFHDDDVLSTTAFNYGAAWLFERNLSVPGGWKKLRKLVPGAGTTRTTDDRAGASVALGDGYAAIGSEFIGNPDAGAVYLFHQEKKDPARWAFVRSLSAPAAPANNTFGFGGVIAFHAGRLVVGAPGFDQTNSVDRGQVFFLSPGCFAQNEPSGDAETRANVAGEPLNLSGLVLNCHPVPFSEVLNIDLMVEQATEGRVEIRDVLNRLVATVYEGDLEGGHALSWAPIALPPGLYYVLVQTKNGKAVKPVVYLRQ